MFSYAVTVAVFTATETYWAPIRYSLISNLYVGDQRFGFVAGRLFYYAPVA